LSLIALSGDSNILAFLLATPTAVPGAYLNSKLIGPF